MATRAGAAVDSDRCVELARALVQCDTQNPPGGESTVIPLLTETLRELGARTEVFEPRPGRPSLLATFAADGTARPTLLINGHTDVVPAIADEWTDPPFAGIIRDGKLIGRGACDMKGGIAAAIEGLNACLDADVTLPCDLVFHLVADEETGGRWGTEALLQSGKIVADAAIIPEPSELQVCVAERGSLMAELTVVGRAAHGSDPGRGRSAVADGARVATALHMAALGDHPHPLLGTPTCNVGVISGGTAANVVASSCVLRVDRRVLPGQGEAEALESLQTLLARATPDVDYRIDVLAFAEASEQDAEHPFVRLAQTACNDGDVAPVRGLFLGTDARFIRNQCGIPAVVYGPGSMTVAHAPDEFVAISDLCIAAQSFARLYTTFDASFAALGRNRLSC